MHSWRDIDIKAYEWIVELTIDELMQPEWIRTNKWSEAVTVCNYFVRDIRRVQKHLTLDASTSCHQVY